jgi:hypothetical protein
MRERAHASHRTVRSSCAGGARSPWGGGARDRGAPGCGRTSSEGMRKETRREGPGARWRIIEERARGLIVSGTSSMEEEDSAGEARDVSMRGRSKLRVSSSSFSPSSSSSSSPESGATIARTALKRSMYSGAVAPCGASEWRKS